MRSTWLLPTVPPSFVGTIREHRINDKEDDSLDRRSGVIATAMLDREATRKRHEKWKAMKAGGMTPVDIAYMEGVDPVTVRRVTGGMFKRSKRPTRKIQVGGEVYESQIYAMRKLHISREKLLKWIDQRKAKYLRG